MADNLFGLSEKAAHALCRAHAMKGWDNYRGRTWRFINQNIGGRPWEEDDRQPHPRKRHLWELRQRGLIYEWFSPWSAPTYLTDDGLIFRQELRKRLGYNG